MTPDAATAQLLNHRLVTTPLMAAGGVNPLAGGPSGKFEGLAYASWENAFYVATPPSSVDVISGSTATIQAVIPVGQNPRGVAVDAATHQVFVSNSGSGNITVINGSTHQSIASVVVGRSPLGLAFDDLNATLYVANNGSGTVSVIAVRSLSVISTLAVGSNPTDVAFYHARNRIYVTNHGSNNVSVISGVNAQLLGTVAVDRAPFGVAVDNVSDMVYVTNEGSNSITVFWAANDTVKLTLQVGQFDNGATDLQGLAYDPWNRMMFVGAGVLWALVLNTTTYTIVDWIGSDPAAVAIDGGTGDVCFTNTANVTFGCFLFNSSSATTYYDLTFTEAGLPAGTEWSIAAARSQRSTTGTSIVFAVVNSTWHYQVGLVPGYTASPMSGDVVVNGSAVTVLIRFVPTTGPVYPLTFVETGLPSGAAWFVNLSGRWNASDGVSIGFRVSNGTYSFLPGTINVACYYALGGSVAISGSPANVSVVFRRGPCGPPPCPIVNFTERGLPAGTNWSVSVTTAFVQVTQWTTGGSIMFDCPGVPLTYAVPPVAGYVASPSSGAINLSVSLTNITLVFHLVQALWANVSFTVVTGDLCTPGATFTVSFDAVAGGGNPPYVYSWDFQDGSPITHEQNPIHTYAGRSAMSPFLAVLTVRDAIGGTTTSFVPYLATMCPAIPAPALGPLTLLSIVVVVSTVAAIAAVVLVVAYAQYRRPPVH